MKCVTETCIDHNSISQECREQCFFYNTHKDCLIAWDNATNVFHFVNSVCESFRFEKSHSQKGKANNVNS